MIQCIRKFMQSRTKTNVPMPSSKKDAPIKVNLNGVRLLIAAGELPEETFAFHAAEVTAVSVKRGDPGASRLWLLILCLSAALLAYGWSSVHFVLILCATFGLTAGLALFLDFIRRPAWELSIQTASGTVTVATGSDRRPLDRAAAQVLAAVPGAQRQAPQN